jgi:hypothetical protein
LAAVAVGVLGTCIASQADHIPGHSNDDPTFPMPIPGQEHFDGGAAWVTLIGPLEGMDITGTTFDITYVSDGSTPASDLLLNVTAQVDLEFVEFTVTGADLGFGSGPGTFEGTFHTEALNGEVWPSFLVAPNSLVDLIIDSTSGGIQGSGYFVDSFITFDIATDACAGDTDGNGVVNTDDLINVISDWGTDGSGHGGDVDGSGLVNVNDLLELIGNWGACE